MFGINRTAYSVQTIYRFNRITHQNQTPAGRSKAIEKQQREKKKLTHRPNAHFGHHHQFSLPDTCRMNTLHSEILFWLRCFSICNRYHYQCDGMAACVCLVYDFRSITNLKKKINQKKREKRANENEQHTHA